MKELDCCDKCKKPFGGDGGWPSNIDGKEVDICHNCWLDECSEAWWAMLEEAGKIVE